MVDVSYYTLAVNAAHSPTLERLGLVLHLLFPTCKNPSTRSRTTCSKRPMHIRIH